MDEYSDAGAALPRAFGRCGGSIPQRRNPGFELLALRTALGQHRQKLLPEALGGGLVAMGLGDEAGTIEAEGIVGGELAQPPHPGLQIARRGPPPPPPPPRPR